MSDFIAALPMYDWPERRAEVDAQWADIRDRLQAGGVDAPENLVRCNADMPPVPGGICDANGAVIAPDPASLQPDALDMHTLWLHPSLLFAQTCWGPMEQGLAAHVRVIGQPSYDGIEGGDGEFYSSAIVMRGLPFHKGEGECLPFHLFRNTRLAFNSTDSMSGIIGLTRDLEAAGESLDIFCERIETGGHRNSIIAVAEGRADVAAIDCLSWHLARLYEPKAGEVQVVGWTAKRKGLPFITSKTMPEDIVAKLRAALNTCGGRPG